MRSAQLTVDYLVKGAGAAGMGFVDSMLTDSDATFAIVDLHDRPGGHWNDSYPFIRLHQPASYYGVNSTPLGTGDLDQLGLNAGYESLASGQEVLAHYDTVMRQRFLPSGRVHYFPMSRADDDGLVTSLLSRHEFRVDAARFVDATHSRMRVPSTTPPTYRVASGISCVPLNDVPRAAPRFDEFVVIGAGKTGMDACIWLLENGADPDRIRWIVPRDSWVLNRANFQSGVDHFARFCKSLADQVEAVALADSVSDVFAWLEAADELRRIDRTVEPAAYHCAILSDDELSELRRIEGVVRLGRVVAIHADRIELEHGELPTHERCLHVDCSAAGIPTHPAVPVFAGDRITLQWVRTCQPTFSAALIGFVEATFTDEQTKNRICVPIEPPTVPGDWLRMLRVDLDNRACWSEYPEIGDWMAAARVDPFTANARSRLGVDAKATEHIQRYLTNIAPARSKLEQLLADPTTEVTA
jgi:hypothetical protein